jgi:hypothetical protein
MRSVHAGRHAGFLSTSTRGVVCKYSPTSSRPKALAYVPSHINRTSTVTQVQPFVICPRGVDFTVGCQLVFPRPDETDPI